MQEAASALLEDKIYVVGGITSRNTIIADTQIYDPGTNRWSKGKSLRKPLAAASAAVANNVLYVFGGTSDGEKGS